MLLTIIVPDKLISKNNIGYDNIDLSFIPEDIRVLQWYEDHGEIEYYGLRNESITELPVWVDQALQAWEQAEYNFYNPPEYIPTAEDNRQKAKGLLFETDWSVTTGINDPQICNPYLVNQNEYIAYRNIIRGIALNPQDGKVEFPVKPDSVWSTL